MRSRSHERHPREPHSHHHAPSRSHSQSNKDRHHSRSSSDKHDKEKQPSSSSSKPKLQADKDKAKKSRSGLRIFIGTANLANKTPDPDSLSAFLPHHGKIHHVLYSSLKSSSIIDGVKKDKWNDINTHGKLEIIAVGMQEATGGNIVTTTGITAKLTGTSIGKERSGFAKAMGPLGKPLDVVNNMVTDVVGSAVKGVSADLGGVKKLKDCIVDHLGEDYTLLTEFQRGEVVLYIFVRNDLADQFKVNDLQGENVGFGSIMANKCGIAVQISIGTTKLSFLSAHLAAHEGQCKLRNDNMAEILAGTNDPTLTSHHSFVFGDLNYRCELPKQANGDELSKEEAKIICQKMVSTKSWSQLYELDELQKALEKKEVLVGFQTPKCKFPPTFKVEKKSGFHYNLQRTPSYTDRILFKSNEETRTVEPIIYEAVSECTSSDHKPVRGLFFLPSRPTLKIDHLKSPLFNIELSHITCKSLKPEEVLLASGLDTFVRVRCEPADLVKNSVRNKFQTSTMKNSDRPMWRKDVLKFSINVVSKELVHGSYIFFESVPENMMVGNSVLGTCVLDLEHLIRKSIDATSDDGKSNLSFEFLRHGKCVGKLMCDLAVSWGSDAPTNRPSSGKQSKLLEIDKEKKSGSDKEKKSSTQHRSKSDGESKLLKKESTGSGRDHQQRSKSTSTGDAHSERRSSGGHK